MPELISNLSLGPGTLRVACNLHVVEEERLGIVHSSVGLRGCFPDCIPDDGDTVDLDLIWGLLKAQSRISIRKTGISLGAAFATYSAN